MLQKLRLHNQRMLQPYLPVVQRVLLKNQRLQELASSLEICL
jgi:hypothetical protein